MKLLAHARAERDPLHQGIIVERSKLKQRDFSLDLTSRLGKSQVITNTTPLNQQVLTASSALCAVHRDIQISRSCADIQILCNTMPAHGVLPSQAAAQNGLPARTA